MSDETTIDYSGTAMGALTEKQRKFVIALLDLGGTNETQAARIAGYSDASDACSVIGCRMIRMPKIQAALKEEAEKRLHGHVLLGASILVQIASDKTHKDQYKAACRLLDQGGLALAIKNEHVHVIKDERSQAELIAFIVAQAKLNGLDPKKLLGFEPPNVVDGEFVEIKEPAKEPAITAHSDDDDPFGIKDILENGTGQ